MVQLTINKQLVEVSEGTTVLQAARQAGIDIPTLCDHPALTPYGGCRLCMVEIEGYRTPTTSCTLPATAGMVVLTDTPALRTSRKFILDMLFSERNHFCPFCQESGGDCELQNAAYAEEMSGWDYPPQWSKFELDTSHSHIVLDHNRCILCRRCIRACGELVGNYTLTAAERGSATLITADYGLPLGSSSCVSCGMCVQVCPTGALIDRASAYKGHEKDWQATQSICVGCSVGCGTTLWTRDNQLVKIDGDWDAPVNAGLTCRQGRFEPMNETRKRLTKPLVRKDGLLQPATWEEAIGAIAQRLIGRSGQDIAALASTRLSMEDLTQLRQLFGEGLGSHIVTSIEEGVPTLAASTLAERLGQPFEGTLEALKSADLVLAIGVDLSDRHQVAGFLVKRLTAAKLPLVIIDPGQNRMAPNATLVLQAQPEQDGALLAALRRALVEGSADSDLALLAGLLDNAQRPVLLYGKGLTRQADCAALEQLHGLAQDLRVAGKAAEILSVKGEANSLAAAQLGLDQPFVVAQQQAAFVALGDDYASKRLLTRLAPLAFKAVYATYASELTDLADVVLPGLNWAEAGGHYLNLDGRLQSAQAVLIAPAYARSLGQVLSDLASSLKLSGSEYHTAGEWHSALTQRPAPVALVLD